MTEGLQSTFPDENIKKYGCYYLCLCQWATILGAPINDNAAVIRIFERHKIAGWVEEDCFVVNPIGILNDLQRAEFFRNVSIVSKRPPEDICLRYLKKPGHGHFVLDNKGQIWDPLDPKRPGVQDYKIDSYRRIV